MFFLHHAVLLLMGATSFPHLTDAKRLEDDLWSPDTVGPVPVLGHVQGASTLAEP
jgi:hypothetical protein